MELPDPPLPPETWAATPSAAQALILALHERLRDAAPLQGMEVAASHLVAIVESTDDAVVGLAFDGTITSWNPGAARIYGYTAAEMLGTSLFRLIPPERTARARAVLARVSHGE